MLTTALLMGLLGQPLPPLTLPQLPLSEDHLRAPPGSKRVMLLLDISSSMNDGPVDERYCLAWNAAHAPGSPVPPGGIADNIGAPGCPFRCDPNFMEDCNPTFLGLPCNPNGDMFMLSKMQQLKAGLTGCITGNDGIFSRWARQVDFGIAAYGFPEAPGARVVQPFTRDVRALRDAVDRLSARGGTPMTAGLEIAGRTQNDSWTDGNAATCDQFFTVMMTDGIANDYCRAGPGGSGDYVNCAPPDFTFRRTCGGGDYRAPNPPTPQGMVDAVRYTYTGRDPTTQIEGPDAICGLAGIQPIRTYTVGFGTGRLIDAPTLQTMARAGGGQYYFAGNARALDSAFQQIIQSIANRSASFTAPTVQTDGLYLGNRVFATSFRPNSTGPWTGNMKSYCVTPPKDARGNFIIGMNDCLFRAGVDPAGGPPILMTNVVPVDTFSGSRSREANVGGVGQNIFRDYFARAAPTSTASAFGPDFFGAGRRHVITWDNAGYKPATPTTMSDAEVFTDGCNKVRLFAYLYGYNPSTVDCNPSAGNPYGRPTELAEWPFGAPVNSQPAILRWGDDCNVAGNCIVALGADDGGVHFIDSSSGRETAMLVPKQLWTPGSVGSYPLSDIFNQPTAQLARRPYVDGAIIKYHDDRNGNGIIDRGEAALLIVGLGKGGKELMFMDVSNPFPGPDFMPTTASNPVFPLVATPGTWAADMRNQMSKPYLGRVKFGPNPAEHVAVFTSGNVWYLDNPQARFNVDAVGLQPPVDYSASRPLLCPQFAYFNGAPPGSCEPGSRDRNCPCTAFDTPLYNCLVTGCEPGVDRPPRSFVIGPFNYSTTVVDPVTGDRVIGTPARAIGQFTFSRFDLQDGDFVIFEDVQGNQLYPPLTGTHPPGFTVNFWAPTPFNIRVSFNGHYSGNTGVALASMRWVPDCNGGGGGHSDVGGEESEDVGCVRGTANAHNPFMVAIDLNRINGASRRPFADTVENGSTRLMFTRQCPAGFSGGTCYDRSNAQTSDLQYMRCPIVAEPRAYEEGGVARAFYVGDQCGQLWKMWTDNGGVNWSAKRVLRLNNDFQGGLSREYRRIDRPVDLAISQCTGGRSVAVYFGTGNTARPGARDDLTGPNIGAIQGGTGPGERAGLNVVGVWFDNGSRNTSATPLTLADLMDLTPGNLGDQPLTFPRGSTRPGWFIALRSYEQMLRDPLVFLGTAFYKTNLSTRQAAACQTAQTHDYIYAVNNCTAAPSQPSPAFGGSGIARDRIVWDAETDVGGNIMLFGSRDTATFASPGVGPSSVSTRASLVNGQASQRALRMYLWWRAQ